MQNEGPSLASLMHRMGECPPEFFDATMPEERGRETTIAILRDVFFEFTPWNPYAPENPWVRHLRRSPPTENEQRFRGLLAAVAWLLHDDWFRAHPETAAKAWDWFQSDSFRQLSELVRPNSFLSDMDRREELVRLCLAAMHLRPQGESIDQAMDRRTTLDTVERSRVMSATIAAERRAREIREAMAAKAAQESASRFGE